MNRKRGLAIVAMLIATSLTAMPAMADEKEKPKEVQASPGARMAMTPAEKEARIREIVDERVTIPGTNPPIPVPARFPEECRLLTILTLDLTLGDLFGDSTVGTGNNTGKSIKKVVQAMRDNWATYKSLAKKDMYFETAVNYKAVETYLPPLLNALRTSHDKISWRKLSTHDIKYKRSGGRIDPDPSNSALFSAFELLSLNAVGGGSAYPLFPFLSLEHKTDTDPATGRRGKVDDTLSARWIGLVGDLSYYDLFTKSYEDVSTDVDSAVQYSHREQLLRVRGPISNVYTTSATMHLAGGGGVDCCCPNVDPATGKKHCADSPDLGCTQTGTPPRCTLGSIYCPANCNF